MAEKNQPDGDGNKHLDKEDLERAETGAGGKAPLAANGEDVFVPDTELDNPPPDAKRSALRNDPTKKGNTGL